MGSKLVLSLCALALLAASSTAMAQQQPTGSWSTSNSNNQSYNNGWQFSSSNAFVSDGTYLYCIGGYSYYYPDNSSFPGYYSATRRFDPANNSWTTMASMAQATYGNTAAYMAGYIYSFGNAYYGSGAIYRYDISADSWSALNVSLSNNRYYAAAAVLGSVVYICGGGFPSNLVDEFDPSANSGAGSITARANMPQAKYYLASAAIPSLNRLYTAGGYNNGYLASCHEYTPPGAAQGANTWREMAQMSVSNNTQPRYGPVAFSLVNRLYVVGGYNNGYQSTTLELSPTNGATGTWFQRANMTYGRYLFGGTVLSNEGYIYGGYSNGGGQALERFIPPDFGLPPNVPAVVNQTGSRAETALQAKADTSQFDGWTDASISFSANVTDPNTTQQVRLRVRVKRTTVSAWTNLDTGLQAQGNLSINFPIPSDGAYDWEWRVEDSYANAYPTVNGSPGWATAFGNATSPDFRSDQIPPSIPVPLFPSNVDIQSPAQYSGDITLYWEEATDNGPVAGISYEIQVAREAGFTDIEAQLFSTAGNDTYPITLGVSRFPKFWRLRARDVGANYSDWSPSLTFRVTFNDGANHSEGDAKRVCGFGAGAGGPAMIGALLGLAILAMSTGRRMFRN
jgi:hypothetical protein